MDNLLVSQPDNGEQALEIAETLIVRAAWTWWWWIGGRIGAACRTQGEMGEPQMGLQARLMSQASES